LTPIKTVKKTLTPSAPIKSLRGQDMTPLVSTKPKKIVYTPKVESKIQQTQKSLIKTKDVNIYRTRECMYGEDCRFRNSPKTNGFHCDFAHNDEEFNTISRVVKKTYSVDNLTRTQPCWRGMDCKIDGCTFAHSVEQLVVRTCFKGGMCSDPKCVFSHPQAKIDKSLVFEMLKEKQKPEILKVSESDILTQMKELEVNECEKGVNKSECEQESEDDVQVFIETVNVKVSDIQTCDMSISCKQSEKGCDGNGCVGNKLEKKPEKKSWADITDEEDEELLKLEEEKKKTPKKWTAIVSTITTTQQTSTITFPTPNKQTPKKTSLPTHRRREYPLYYRTNMCRNGDKCTRGDSCDFAHSKSELRPVCCQDENCNQKGCSFYHEGNEIPTSEQLYSAWYTRDSFESV